METTLTEIRLHYADGTICRLGTEKTLVAVLEEGNVIAYETINMSEADVNAAAELLLNGDIHEDATGGYLGS